MSEQSSFPDEALEEIAYLSRSNNRAEVLAMLATESYTRRELANATDIARTTLDRIINELEERHWVARTTDGEYTTTPTGERIASVSSRFVGAVEAVRSLGEAVAWLPNDELRIGLHNFKNATVRRPEPNAMNAPSKAATELMREATEFACLVNTPPSLAFEEAMMNAVLDGRLATNHVITDSERAVLQQDVDRASRWQQYVEAGANLYCYEGQIPCNLLVIDDTVLILDEQPEAAEGIESTNPEVRAWALDLINEYREDAERLDAVAFN